MQCLNVYVKDNKAQFLVIIENEMKQLHIKNEARAQFHDKNKKVPAPNKKKQLQVSHQLQRCQLLIHTIHQTKLSAQKNVLIEQNYNQN